MHAKLNQIQTQKQILAPNMQQSIEVLMLPLMELETTIELELQNNPLLEMSEEQPSSTSETSVQEMNATLERLEKISQDDSSLHYQQPEVEDDFPTGALMTRAETLEEALLQQLRVELANPLDLKIGEFIIGNIDEDGYLKTSCEEIAKILEITDLPRILKILKIIQSFEPVGIASRDLKECLLAQAHAKFHNEHTLTFKIINNYLPELGQKKFSLLAKNLGVPVERIKEAAKLIAALDPKPARNYRQLRTDIYIKPDVYITHSQESGYQIQCNDEHLPMLRVNPIYRNMLKKGNLTPEERAFIREKLTNALYFIKSIEQRGKTIREIAKFILAKQKAFFENGPMVLVPMNLRDVAEVIQRNESTISRAIHNKYIDTPQGLFPMKFFFSQGVGNKDSAGDHSEGVANRSIKEEMKDLVESEDKTHPLSDQAIQKYFATKGTTLARRTISKYRQALNILPSHLRKE